MIYRRVDDDQWNMWCSIYVMFFHTEILENASQYNVFGQRVT